MNYRPESENGSDRVPFNSEIASILRNTKQELEKVATDASINTSKALDSIREELRKLRKEVNNCVEVTSALTVSLTPGVSKKSSLSALVRAQSRTVDHFMTPDFQSLLCTATVCKFLERRSISGSIYEPMQSLKLLMFAPDSLNRTEARKSVNGRLFQQLRTTLLKNCVYNCECSAGKDYSPGAKTGTVNNARRKGPNVCNSDQSSCPTSNSGDEVGSSAVALQRPLWTRKNFIKPSYIDAYVNDLLRTETKSPSPEPPRSGSAPDTTRQHKRSGAHIKRPPPKRLKEIGGDAKPLEESVSKEVLRALWLKQTDWLNTARWECRKIFTKMIGFLFYQECNPVWTYRFPSQYLAHCNDLPDSQISSTLLHSIEINKRNRSVMQEICNDHPLLALRCTYDVEVFRSDKECSQPHVYGESRNLRTQISLLEVALQMCTSYFQCTDTASFLQSSACSIRTAFRVALAIAFAVQKADDNRVEGKLTETSYDELKELGVFMISEPSRIALIKESALRMTVARYNCLSGVENSRDELGGEDSVEVRVLSDDEEVENIFR